MTTVELSEIARKYDADEDGLLSRAEAIPGVNDYFSGVIALYFESPATVTDLLGESG